MLGRCAFPMGALLSHQLFEHSSSQAAVNVVRTVVAGVFTCIALSSRSPFTLANPPPPRC